jgi:hypothetical protein
MKRKILIAGTAFCLPAIGLLAGILCSVTAHCWMFGWNIGTMLVRFIRLFG